MAPGVHDRYDGRLRVDYDAALAHQSRIGRCHAGNVPQQQRHIGFDGLEGGGTAHGEHGRDQLVEATCFVQDEIQ